MGQASLTHRQWDKEGKVVAGGGTGDDLKWHIARQNDLITCYHPDIKIDGITAQIEVGTPQDGTWLISACVEVDPSGRGLLPSLFPRSWDRDARYESREAAESDAKRLMSNLTTEAMLEQFIGGVAIRYEDIDSRDIETIREQLTSGP